MQILRGFQPSQAGIYTVAHEYAIITVCAIVLPYFLLANQGIYADLISRNYYT